VLSKELLKETHLVSINLLKLLKNPFKATLILIFWNSAIQLHKRHILIRYRISFLPSIDVYKFDF